MTYAYLETKERIEYRREADAAFDTALATGRLTETMGQPNYVGDYRESFVKLPGQSWDDVKRNPTPLVDGMTFARHARRVAA